jgi:hypothetical protein
MNTRRDLLITAGACLLLAGTVAAPALDKFAVADVTKREFFPILPWDPLRGWDGQGRECETNGLKSMTECHFNMAGFVLAKDLPECRALGLGAIVVPPPESGSATSSQTQWKQLTDEEIDRRIRAMVKYAGSSPAVKGYFIMDEPGVSDFPALAKAVAAVKKYAPGKLAYINLFPDYATTGPPATSQLGMSSYTEYLERFVADVHPQMLSYDNYTVQYSGDLKDRATGASYFRNLLEVRRVAQKHGLPYLQIVASTQILPAHPIPSPANLAVQAYTTLAAGCRGVTWYTYYDRGYHYASIDSKGQRTPTWGYLCEVNRQVAALAPVLSKLASTGIYFSAPPPAEGLPLLPGQVIEAVGSSTPVMVGEFRSPQGEMYSLLVNLSLERSAKVEVKTKEGMGVLGLISAMDGKLRPMPQEKAGLWLTAGQGVLIQARPLP